MRKNAVSALGSRLPRKEMQELSYYAPRLMHARRGEQAMSWRWPLRNHRGDRRDQWFEACDTSDELRAWLRGQPAPFKRGDGA